ncbi:MAG: hypothetical protein AB1726_04545 [Planctomycetota bacterium]
MPAPSRSWGLVLAALLAGCAAGRFPESPERWQEEVDRPGPSAAGPQRRSPGSDEDHDEEGDEDGLLDAVLGAVLDWIFPFDGGDLESEGPTGPFLGIERLPLVTLHPDEDPSEPGGGFELDGDPDAGDGFGLEAGYRDGLAGIGILYLTSEHREHLTREHVRLQAALVELRIFAEQDLGPFASTLSLGVGAGLAGVDFAGDLDDAGGAAWGMRGSLGARFAEHVGLELGGGYLEWGALGERVAASGYTLVGITWHPR